MTQDRPDWLERVIHPHVLSIPPYVPGKPVEELKRELGVPDAVKMASNENPLGPSPMAIEALKKHVARAHVYPESSAPELREALAAHYGVSADSVILGNGSDEIMQLAAHVLIGAGDEAVMAENAFSMYRIVVEAFAGQSVLVPLLDYRSDLKGMADAITERTRLVFLSIPHSPTGTVVSKEEFDDFVRRLPGERLLLVIDEAYGEYVRDENCPRGLDYIGGKVPVIVLRTFSKIYGLAGLRVGYGIAQPWFIEILNRVRAPFNVNSLAQAAALAALHDTGHVERSRKVTADGILFLTNELQKMGFEVIPSQANFLSFRVGDKARAVYEALLRCGVIVRHLASFGMGSFIRVTVGTDKENQRFVDAMARVMR